MGDLERVRDEWQHALHEKDLELKRSKADFAAHAERLLEDYQTHSTHQALELKQEHF